MNPLTVMTDVGKFDVVHDVRSNFITLLRDALADVPIGCCLGPIYDQDPAEKLLKPFLRSREISGNYLAEGPGLFPDWIGHRVYESRQRYLDSLDPISSRDLQDWSRAGLVLEICRISGFRITREGFSHVDWRLNGTKTGRFGIGPAGSGPIVNPMCMKMKERARVIPRGPGRLIVRADYNAIDIRSVLAMFPELRKRFDGYTDLHARTADICGIDRDDAKIHFFRHFYGGFSEFAKVLDDAFPELRGVRSLPPGEFARCVQSVSARAFRAGLSRALPLLTGDLIVPMFTVHDEITLDVHRDALSQVPGVLQALEEGSSERLQMNYLVNAQSGMTYEASRSHDADVIPR